MFWSIIKARLSEPSTWKGILALVSGAGLSLNGVQIDQIAAAMVAVYSALSVLLPDKFGK